MGCPEALDELPSINLKPFVQVGPVDAEPANFFRCLKQSFVASMQAMIVVRALQKSLGDEAGFPVVVKSVSEYQPIHRHTLCVSGASLDQIRDLIVGARAVEEFINIEPHQPIGINKRWVQKGLVGSRVLRNFARLQVLQNMSDDAIAIEGIKQFSCAVG